MVKVSRPVIYTALAAVVAYAVVVLTQPDTPHHKTVVLLTNSSQLTNANGYTQADVTAHFARYVTRKVDPFAPVVVPQNPAAVTPSANALQRGSRGGWALTGVNVVDGVTTALVENSATTDTIFLKPGDNWNGLHVVSVDSDTVTFENAIGQKTHLTFVTTEPDPRSNTSPNAVPPVPSLPGLPAPSVTISPMPVIGAPGTLPNGYQRGSSN